MTQNILTDLLQNKELASLIDSYLSTSEAAPESTAAGRYPAYAQRLESQRFVVPVVGVQGSGKSTLLNALVFTTPVLPVDADETTCVPVEIIGTTKAAEFATVMLKNGQSRKVTASEESLKEFVHNGMNPGNEKGVDRIILESPAQMFQNGLVLVDLPGTGSLTAANQETTLQYLDEAVGIAFLLRTVPPITRSEATFITLQWARLPTAFFIQNRWNDETDQEAEDGREHNLRALRDLARRCRIPTTEEPVISVVNGYKALEGRLTQNQKLIEGSGINQLTQVIEGVAQEWPIVLKQGIWKVVEDDIARVCNLVKLQIEQLSASREELESRMAEEQKRFDKYIGILCEKVAAAYREATTLQDEQKKALRQWSNESRAILRNNMRTKMRAGIVDGVRLDQALQDEQSVVAYNIFAEVQEAILVFQESLRERFKDVGEWRLDKVMDFKTVGRYERTKFENIAPALLGGGAGIGGWYTGGLAAAKIGAAIGTTAGPVGTAIGAIVGGIIGGFLGDWLGGKTRKVALQQRAKAAEGEVFRAIDEFLNNTSDGFSKQIKSFCKKIEDFLAEWELTQVVRFEKEREIVLGSISAGKEEKERNKIVLEKDLARAEDFLALLQGGMA